MYPLAIAFLRRFVFCWVIILPSAAPAQEPNPPEKPGTAINERTIYVPYDKLREVFERDGRGVFLPYDQFQQLWNAARANSAAQPELGPPLGAVIADIESVATLGREIVNVDAKLKIEILRAGWHRVPLRLNGVAIRSATIDNRPARVVSLDDGQFELLVAHDTDEPRMIELSLSYAKALNKLGGQSNVSFAAPQSSINRWTIRSGQSDVDVQIEPMIATSKKPTEPTGIAPAENKIPGDEIQAFVGAAPEVKIVWTPKSEGAAGLSALVSAENKTQFQIDQGVARTSALVTLDISRAEIRSLSLSVPADQKVVNVFDRNVKKWDVKPVDAANPSGPQTILVELFEPTLGRQQLAIELESFVEDSDGSVFSAPPIAVNDISRNSGVVVVRLATDLRGEVDKKTGLLQMDQTELPPELTNQAWDFAYRYAALPFDFSLKVKKIQPLINVEQLVEIAIRPIKMQVELSAIYDIQLTGVFQLVLDVPVEFEIREIRPLTLDGLANIPIDTFYRDTISPRRVIVTLSKKAIGKMGLLVSLTRELTDVNLLTPSETAAEIQAILPKAALEDIEFSQGHAIVYSTESLQINAASTTGLRADSFETAQAKLASALSVDDLKPRLAFSFSHTPAEVKLTAKRRKPQVTAEQVVTVSIQSGVVKYDARLFYEVLYSGVKSLRLDVPSALVGELRNRSEKVLYQAIAPQPDDVRDGFTAWELTGDTEFFGKHEFRFTWEEKIAELTLGESAAVSVERLIPAAVDRASGQIVLTKSETVDVRPDADTIGLRPIDPQTDLFQGIQISDSALAFEFVDDWKLNLIATRFELQELKQTSISRAVVRVVALRQNELSVQCLYQVRSVGQRISLQLPAGFDAATSFDDQPIRINGRRVTPERGGKDLIYIPLTGQASDTPFLLEIRYNLPGLPNQIDLPVFTDEPAVQKVYLCVYLPQEQAMLHQSGPWTDEAIDENSGSIAAFLNSGRADSLTRRMFRRRQENVDALLSWVVEGVNVDGNASQKFEVDGRPYVFSALRPMPAPEGSLQLRTFSLTILNVVVCGLMVLVGLVLCRSTITRKLAGMLLGLAVLVFLGVLFPLVTEHLLSESLLLTAGLVGLTWAVFHVRRWFQTTPPIRSDHQLNSIRSVFDRVVAVDPNFVGVDPASHLDAVDLHENENKKNAGGEQ